MVGSGSSSSRRSSSSAFPTYIDPEQSMTKLSRRGGCFSPSSRLASASVPRRLKTSRSPAAASTRRLSSSSPSDALRSHTRSRERSLALARVDASVPTEVSTRSSRPRYMAHAFSSRFSISPSRSLKAWRFTARARARASSETAALSASETWCTGLPSVSRYGPPRPPRPAVSEPPVPPAHVLPPTCGLPSLSTFPCLASPTSVLGVDAAPSPPALPCARYRMSIFSPPWPP